MQIRKAAITVAGVTMLAGGLATIGSAQASTFSPEPHDHSWCIETFGQSQDYLCTYYNDLSDRAYHLRSTGQIQEAEAYHTQINETLIRLINSKVYG
ncbi:hypothetical protein [Corynebacterium rouxii]|uniref:Secreted protein n=1 Tax=Corynebacterium rouxii TaxID=2719119 RepID=A0A6I8MFI5_9CORY|nr:hypothetical protein [Corynebacterium rouxii]MDT9407812.1 hypothetical protein [Corynebacterium rouxii]MDT9409994.1 hypothetical protein [Corynebacterium rouxii]VZH84074.1 hypothetical protein FRC0190_00115 [Corynebacterium rouxii]